MRNKTFRIAVVVIIAPLIVLGAVLAVLENDQSMLLTTVLVTVLYVIYLCKLIPRLKKEKSAQTAQKSPLQNRR